MVPSFQDEERGIPPQDPKGLFGTDAVPADPGSKEAPSGIFARLNAYLDSTGFFEERGVERVPLHERHALKASDYMQMTLLWFSTNITANNMAVGMLGPLDYSLGFVDAALCATFGALLGAAGVAYMATFGPASGNRTMVFSLTNCGFCSNAYFLFA